MVITPLNIVWPSPDPAYNDSQMYPPPRPMQGKDMTGIPLFVLEVSLPFVSVTTAPEEDGSVRGFPLNTRDFHFIKVKKPYALSVSPKLAPLLYPRHYARARRERQAAQREAERDRASRQCPECGGGLVLRTVYDDGVEQAKGDQVACKDCNWVLPIPPAPATAAATTTEQQQPESGDGNHSRNAA